MPYKPLFWCLKTRDQIKLIQYQWAVYKEILSIPKPPDVSQAAWEATIPETLGEIDKLMQQKPSHQKRVD